MPALGRVTVSLRRSTGSFGTGMGGQDLTNEVARASRQGRAGEAAKVYGRRAGFEPANEGSIPSPRTDRETRWGVALPWNLIASAALGLWLMASPTSFGSTGWAAHSDHLAGALVVTVAIVALADVGRAARFINVAFGAWFILAPWVLTGDKTTAAWNDVAVGIVLALISLPRGPVGERYGSWQRYIR